ncbi:MAG: hypothetical protein SVN78_02155 [Deferribacterota bacterium]|nr:hypothetical protein [Deferribacterota bacterium]
MKLIASTMAIRISSLSCILILFFLFSNGLFAQNNKLIDLQRWEKRLEEKEKRLNRKEQELLKKEKENKLILEAIEKENRRLKKQKQELVEIGNNIKTLKEQVEDLENKNLDKLANIYNSAKARDAARVISNMDVDTAVKLFKRLSPMAAGEIMSELGKTDPKFASEVSERLAVMSDNKSSN